jgi:hypothetical protein
MMLQHRFPWRLAAVIVAISAPLGGLPAAAFAQGVAMVTDVSGRVTGQDPVTILSELRADARVQVERGAKLVVMYLRSGDEYVFTGPAQIQFRAAEPQVLSGASPQRKASPIIRGGNVTIRPAGVGQGAFVMRSARPTARIKLLALSGTRTLDAVPEFRWQEIEPGVKYRFELTDDTGKLLHEAEVAGNALKLPAAVPLREGVGYTWGLSARLGDGRRYTSSGDFSLAPAALRAQAMSLRPREGAPVSERVAFAAWLEQVELKDEARKYWKALALERPEAPRLKALAAE